MSARLVYSFGMCEFRKHPDAHPIEVAAVWLDATEVPPAHLTAADHDHCSNEHSESGLTLTIKGIPAVRLRRGVTAALETFAKWDYSPEECVLAIQVIDDWEAGGYVRTEKPRPTMFIAAAIWDYASEAAILACCGPGSMRPEGSVLSLGKFCR